jgi:serine/threonine protein phosphatase PrpC
MFVQSAARTDVGLVRHHNEDAMLADVDHQVFAVCDGVGGRAGGEVASQLAVQHLARAVAQHGRQLAEFSEGLGATSRRDIERVLEAAILDASVEIRSTGLDNVGLSGMATTVVALLVAGDHAFVAHVGDSRAYLLRSGVLHQLTEDHSVANEMRRRGRDMLHEMTPRMSEALTRALGALDVAKVDLIDLELLPGDRFVLSTDGVHRVLGDAQLQAIVARGDCHAVADDLIEAALQAGAPDNATCVVVDIVDEAAADRSTRVRRRLEALQALSMFRYLPYVDLIRVASVAKELHLPAGGVVFREGDPADGLYVILDGSALVTKADVEIVEIQPGGHFGEMSLVERMPRSATVSAKTDLDVLMIEREPFYGLLSEEQVAVKLLWAMLRMLNRRLRETSEELSQLKAGQRDLDDGAL